MESRKQFTFYRSFREAIKRIRNDSDRAMAYDAICDYGLYGIEPDLDSMPDAVAILFCTVRPNLDSGRRKADGGMSGSPSKDTAKIVKSSAKDSEKIAERCCKDVGNKKENKKEKEIEIEKELEIEYECNTPLSPLTGGGEAVTGEIVTEKPQKKAKNQTPKVQWAEFVTMTNAEHDKLLDAYGPADTARMIEILDNYKGSTGKKYASDYRACLNWVADRVREENAKIAKSTNIFYEIGKEEGLF